MRLAKLIGVVVLSMCLFHTVVLAAQKRPAQKGTPPAETPALAPATDEACVPIRKHAQLRQAYAEALKAQVREDLHLAQMEQIDAEKALVYAQMGMRHPPPPDPRTQLRADVAQARQLTSQTKLAFDLLTMDLKARYGETWPTCEQTKP
jgi:hypothetical protein